MAYKKKTKLDEDMSEIVKIMLSYKIIGATGSIVKVEDKNEIVYTWHNPVLERQYLELEAELYRLAKLKLEEK